MDYLLYNRRAYITGRALATQLGLKATRSVKKLKRLGKAPVIRYGCSEGNFGDSETPLYRKFSLTNIPEFPFLLRRLHHMGGRDIILINSMDDLRKLSVKQLANRYWVAYTETTFELRVHVINGQIARVFKKINPGAKSRGEFVRSSKKGWHYSLRENLDEKYIKAQRICLNIMEDLGLVFGGVDIAWDNDNRRYVIWEVNTAPGLSQPTLNIYGALLRELLYGN